jgi:hypothetical protein
MSIAAQPQVSVSFILPSRARMRPTSLNAVNPPRGQIVGGSCPQDGIGLSGGQMPDMRCATASRQAFLGKLDEYALEHLFRPNPRLRHLLSVNRETASA